MSAQACAACCRAALCSYLGRFCLVPTLRTGDADRLVGMFRQFNNNGCCSAFPEEPTENSMALNQRPARCSTPRARPGGSSEPLRLCEGDNLTNKGIILAVDDAPGSLWLLTEILTAEGYDVRPADNGELALAAVAASKPELILLDVRMAGMDGFEVCRRLKEKSNTRDIPVMFISAVNDTRDRVAGLKCSALSIFFPNPSRKKYCWRVSGLTSN